MNPEAVLLAIWLGLTCAVGGLVWLIVRAERRGRELFDYRGGKAQMMVLCRCGGVKTACQAMKEERD
jgi:hypothetical protein